MALLQSDKAIFYHPLDGATETLQSQSWTGTGIFSTAKISNGLAAPSGTTPAFGLESEFLPADGVIFTSIAVLSTTKFVVAYRDVADFSHGTAKVGTVSGTDITYGAEAEFLVGSSNNVAVMSLSATVIVVAYKDNSDLGHGTAKIGTVSGTAITFGAETEFNSAGSSQDISLAKLSASTLVVVYRDSADLNHGTAKVGTVSGTDITFGAENEFDSGASGQIAAAAVSATKFVVVYRPASTLGTSKVGTVSGAAITFGAAVTFNGSSTFNQSVVGIDSTKVVVSYRDDGDGSKGKAKVGTISGTDITYGAATTFATLPQMSSGRTLANLSSTAFAAVWHDLADLNHGTSRVGTVSGTDITFGTEIEFLSDATDSASGDVGGLNSGAYVVGYKDINNANHGTCKVGSLAGSAARSASTPAAYGTAAAATKVVFAGWMKNPSA